MVLQHIAAHHTCEQRRQAAVKAQVQRRRVSGGNCEGRWGYGWATAEQRRSMLAAPALRPHAIALGLKSARLGSQRSRLTAMHASVRVGLRARTHAVSMSPVGVWVSTSGARNCGVWGGVCSQ